MRLTNKYKIYNQTGIIPDNFHNRILKFKRPKWKKIQKTLFIQNLSSKVFFINNFCVKNSIKIWDKVGNYYKQGLKTKNILYSHFDRSIGNKDLKKLSHLFDNREILLNILLKPEFRIDILLWRLKIFNSSYQVRQALHNKLILVNNKSIKGNYILKKGDIITFSLNIKLLNLTRNFSIFNINKNLIPFLEIDYYTNTIIIVKDLLDLYKDDICLLNSEFYSLKSIKDLI